MTRRRSSSILTTLAVILWAISLLQAKLAVGFYGLINSYHITYFIALGLLTFASFILWIDKEEGHGWLLCIQLILFIAIIWLTPVLIGGNPVTAQWTYEIYYPNTKFILNTGHFNQGLFFNKYDLWTMQNWPSSFIFETAIIQITRFNTANFIAYWGPLLMQFLFIPFLYLFFKNVTQQSKFAWAACWLFFLANWTSQIYYSPQALGLLLLITALTIVTRKNNSSSLYIILLLVLATLPFTHFLTSIIAIFSIAVFVIKKRSYVVLTFAAVIVIAWTIYGTTSELNVSLPHYIERAFNIDLVFQLSASGIKNASSSLYAVSHVRYLFTAMFSVIAIIGLSLSYFFKKVFSEKSDLRVFLLFLPVIIVLFSMLYQSEYWTRAYLFALFPLAYFSVKLLKNRYYSIALILILLIGIPLFVISNYGYASVDYRPKGEISYWNFMNENSITAYVVGGSRIYDPGYSYSIYYLDEEKWDSQKSILESQYDLPQYIHIGMIDKAVYSFYRNDSSTVLEIKTDLAQSPNYSCIYANPDASLYFHEGT